jgi:hypothetical protein
MLKFLKSGSNFKVKVTKSNNLVPIERSCHKEHTYENPYHLPFKRYGLANVEVLADRRTSQILYAPDLSIRGHKNIKSVYLGLHLQS